MNLLETIKYFNNKIRYEIRIFENITENGFSEYIIIGFKDNLPVTIKCSVTREINHNLEERFNISGKDYLIDKVKEFIDKYL